MTVRSIRALLGASLLVAVGACGDDSSSPSGPSPVATLPLEYVSTFGGTGTSLPGLAFHAIGFEGTNINLSAGDAPRAAKDFLAARLSGVAGGTAVAAVLSSPDCTPDEVGAATDTDGDGIPDDATLTFTVANCTVYDTATGDAQLVRGKYRIQDTNDDLYGFTVTLTDLHVRNFTTAGGSVYDVTYNATESATTKATSGSYRLTLAAAIAQGNTGGVQHQIVNYDLTGKFTPSGNITDGDPLPNGTFTLTGTLDATLDAFGPPTRMVMQVVTPTPMSFTTACGDVNSGSYELRLNGRTDEGVHIKFQACNGYYEILGSDAL